MTIFEVLFLVIVWTWVGAAALFLRTTILPRLPLSATPAAWSVPFEPVRFRATDGVRLAGWKVLASAQEPWIILCHGLGTNRADVLDLAMALWKAGYNLFLFDFRAHGESEGRVTSFGWREQRDLKGALVFLGQDPEVADRPYGVFGVSMGGAVAVMVAAGDERLGAVAVDSIYGDLQASMDHHIRLMYRLPRVPFGFWVSSAYRLRFGVWPRRMSPRDAVADVSPRPVLIIHGDRDSRMPMEETRRLFEAAREPKTLWIVEGADHLGAFGHDPDAYTSRLVAFFDSSLKR